MSEPTVREQVATIAERQANAILRQLEDRDLLHKILAQTTATNGRVGDLERRTDEIEDETDTQAAILVIMQKDRERRLALRSFFGGVKGHVLSALGSAGTVLGVLKGLGAV